MNKLKLSEEKFRALAENIPGIIYMYDETGEGKRTTEYFGPDNEILFGKESGKKYFKDINVFFENIFPEDFEKVSKHANSIVETGENLDQSFRVKTDSGYIWLRTLGKAIKLDSGIIRWQGVMVNIQARKETESKLKQSEEKFRAFTEHSTDITIIANRDFKFIYASPSVKQFAYIPDDILNFNALEIIHPEDHLMLRNKRIHSEKHPGEAIDIPRIRIYHKDKSIVYLEGILTCLYNVNSINGLVFNGRNITLRIKAEKKLKESEERFRHLFNYAAIGILGADFKGNILIANPHTVEMLGYSSFQEFAMVNLENDIVDSQEDINAFLSLMKEIGEVHNQEARWKKKDGSLIIVNINAKKFPSADGKTNYIEGIIEDITERKQVEKRIKRFNIELEEKVNERTKQLEFAKAEISEALDEERKLTQLKTSIITRTSHEYRTPLTVIQSSTYLLKHYFESGNIEMFYKHINRINNTVRNMINILEEVLEIGRSDNNASELSISAFSIKEFIDNLIAEIRINDNDLHLIDYEIIADNFEINTDRNLLHKIVAALLNNARKFSPEHTSIKINILKERKDFKIIIKDNGIGIHAQDIDHVYEPFYRGTNVSDDVPGIGLGLTMVKKYVASLDGIISVESSPGQGAKFKIIIPIGSGS